MLYIKNGPESLNSWCVLRHAMSHYVSFQIALSAKDHLETRDVHILTLLVYKKGRLQQDLSLTVCIDVFKFGIFLVSEVKGKAVSVRNNKFTDSSGKNAHLHREKEAVETISLL